MRKTVKIFLWSIASVVVFVVMLIGLSAAYYRYDGLVNVKEKHVSSFPEYYKNIAINQCARPEPFSSRSKSIQRCCLSSVQRMYEKNGTLAPLAFTENPSRGCKTGSYMRIMCGGSLEWCEDNAENKESK